MRQPSSAELAELARLRQLPPEQRVIQALNKSSGPTIRPALPLEKMVKRW